MSFWRDSEDEDGTRHYTRRAIFGVPVHFSMTRDERRRMSRQMMLTFVGMIVAGWLGYLVRQDAVGVYLGLVLACVPLLLITVVVRIVAAIRETRNGSPGRDGG